VEDKTTDTKFKPGDKVHLISGGPEMTIRGTHFDVLANEFRYDMFDCIWFEKDEHGKYEVHYCPFFSQEIVKNTNE
jgi:uncharacterized protein YodC (DUF2158 family)